MMEYAPMSILVNAYSTLTRPPAPRFQHTLRGQRDRSDDELASHLNGFVGFLFREDPQMTATLYATMRHVQRVRHHLSFEIEEGQLDELAAWSWQANAILFMPDGSVLNPAGKELLSVDGAPGDASLPYPEDALERRERSRRKLADLGVSTPASLPPVLSELEVSLREPSAVALRALALLTVAVRAESLASGEPIPVPSLRERLPLGFDALSPMERAFLETESPEQQAIVNHAWRYEALFVLEWALGWFREISLPTTTCDVPAVARAVFDGDARDLVDRATLRPAAEILELHDLSFRLHWAAREAVHNRKEAPPAGLDSGVIQERRHALGWLVRFEDAEWDDVDTPT
jgi:hypothetical protein